MWRPSAAASLLKFSQLKIFKLTNFVKMGDWKIATMHPCWICLLEQVMSGVARGGGQTAPGDTLFGGMPWLGKKITKSFNEKSFQQNFEIICFYIILKLSVSHIYYNRCILVVTPMRNKPKFVEIFSTIFEILLKISLQISKNTIQFVLLLKTAFHCDVIGPKSCETCPSSELIYEVL